MGGATAAGQAQPDPATRGAVRRLRTRAQFQALLRRGACARTPHFMLYRLPLDSADAATLFAAPGAPWLGALVPKRWARRAVRRNLIRRQIHAVGAQQLAATSSAWLVRLRAPFPRTEFPSAASAPLRRAVRSELLQLFRQMFP